MLSKIFTVVFLFFYNLGMISAQNDLCPVSTILYLLDDTSAVIIRLGCQINYVNSSYAF